MFQIFQQGHMCVWWYEASILRESEEDYEIHKIIDYCILDSRSDHQFSALNFPS